MKELSFQKLFVYGFTFFLFLIMVFSNYINLKNIAFFALAFVIVSIFFLPNKWSLLLIFTYICFEGFLKIISRYNPFVHVGADILVVILCLKVIIQRIWFRQGIPWPPPPLTFFIIVHFVWFLVVFANPYALSFISSLAATKLYVTMFTLYFFGFHHAKNIKEINLYMVPWVVASIIHMVLSLQQASAGPKALLALSPGYAAPLAKFATQAFRPFGATSLPGGPAIFLFITAPLFIYFIIQSKSLFVKILLGVCIPFNLIVFFLCQVRSALFKAVLGTTLILIFYLIPSKYKVITKTNWKKIATVVSIILMLSYFSYRSQDFLGWVLQTQGYDKRAFERTESLFDSEITKARRGAWDRFVMYLSEIPLGAGLSRTGAVGGKFIDLIEKDSFFPKDHFFTDNLFLVVLIDLGIPGLLILSILIIILLFVGIRQLRTLILPEFRLINMAILSSLISIVIGSYGAEGLIYNPEAPFFWFFSGVMIKLKTLDRFELSQVKLRSLSENSSCSEAQYKRSLGRLQTENHQVGAASGRATLREG